MAIADGHGLPISVTLHSATPFETTLVETTIKSIPIGKKPEKMIGDKAYSSFPLAQRCLEKFEIELIAPIKSNARNPWQDGRKLRRYKRRWKIERLFAWLGNFRRLPIRWERSIENYFGFVLLACSVILWRHL
jgi:transposase